MRYIERGPEPEILRANRNSKKSWQEIVIQANAGPEIKQQLLQMQKNLCARYVSLIVMILRDSFCSWLRAR